MRSDAWMLYCAHVHGKLHTRRRDSATLNGCTWMHISIIGLPNSTKTTIFNALTRGHAETAAFSSGHAEVHSAQVDVPDARIDRLSSMFVPRKTTYAKVTYADVPGLGRGQNTGSLSGPLLNILSQSDALLYVVRAFEDPDLPPSEGTVDPRRDLGILDGELLLSDQIIVERRIERLEAQLQKGSPAQARSAGEAELSTFRSLRDALDAGRPLRDCEPSQADAKMLRNYGLLTLKPALVVLNVGDVPAHARAGLLRDNARARVQVIEIQGRLEMELAQLPPQEAAEFLASYGIEEPGLNRVIRASYALLGLHSFFTVGEDEVRAWPVPIGATAIEAARAIHSDLARGFIRAEVIGYDALIECGGLPAARQKGLLRLEGKDYAVQDGDVLNIRFNV